MIQKRLSECNPNIYSQEELKLTLLQFTETINIRSNMSIFYNHFEEVVILYKILSPYMATNSLSVVISTKQLSNNTVNLKANISCDNIDLLRELMARFNNSSFIIFERNLKCKINLLKNNALNMSITKRQPLWLSLFSSCFDINIIQIIKEGGNYVG